MGLPDLVWQNINIWNNQTNVQQQQSFYVEGTNSAIMQTFTNTFREIVYLSSNTTIDANDYAVYTKTWYGISGLGTNTFWNRCDVSTNMPPGIYYVIGKMDASNQVSEYSEANNVAVASTRITVSALQPDLQISSIALGVSSPITVRTFNVTVTGRNNGPGSASQEKIWCYLSANTSITTGDIYLGENVGSSLGSGQSRDLTVQCNLPSDITNGYWYIGAIIDPGNSQTETNESNNSFVYPSQVQISNPTPLADLAISAGSLVSQVNVGQDLSLDVIMMNKGDAAANSFHVGWYLGTYQGDKQKLGKEFGPYSLAVGQTATNHLVYTTVSGDDSYGAITIVLDNRDEVQEKDSWGNEWSAAVTISQNYLPDFVVTNIVLNPASPTAGTPFSAVVTIQNQGNVSGNGGFLHVWVNQASSVNTGDDTWNQSWQVNTLNASESRPFTFTNLIPPVAGGPYTFRAFVDGQGNTTESNEANNQTTLTYSVSQYLSSVDVVGHWSYTRRAFSKTVTNAVRFARIEIYDNEPAPLPPVPVAVTNTDDNGDFNFFGIPNNDGPLEDGIDLFCVVYTDYGLEPSKCARVGTYSLIWPPNDCVAYSESSPVHGNCTGGTVDFGELLITNNAAFDVYDDAVTEYNFFKEASPNHANPKIYIFYPDNTPIGLLSGLRVTFSGGTPVSYFNQAYNFIGIRETDPDFTTTFHEYGHAIMRDIYGGTLPSGTNDPPSHYYGIESNPQFAMDEGWAAFCGEFFAGQKIATRWNLTFDEGFEDQWKGVKGVADGEIGRGSEKHFADVEDTNGQNGYECDGATVEGAIAEVFWDVNDGGGTDDDAINSDFNSILATLTQAHPQTITEFKTSYLQIYPTRANALTAIYQMAKIERTADTVAPQPVGALSAVFITNGFHLSWSSPSDVDVGGYVCFKIQGSPHGRSEPLPQSRFFVGDWEYGFALPDNNNQVVYVGTGNDFSDTNILPGVQYSYTVYTYDTSYNYSEGASVSPTVPSTGALLVVISPSEAALNGAAWRVDGGSWQNSGSVIAGLVTGLHTVTYLDVLGWVTPVGQNATIWSNQTTTITGVYVRTSHYVTTPTQLVGTSAGLTNNILAFSVGGATCNLGHTVQYRYDWGDGIITSWGATTNATHAWTLANTYSLRAQARCTSDTNILSSWSPAKAVTITNSPSQPTTGAVRVTITPSDVVAAGAYWRLDGGTWQNTGTVLAGLSADQHTIDFSDVSGWSNPTAMMVVVLAGQTNTLTATYQSGSETNRWAPLADSFSDGDYSTNPTWTVSDDGGAQYVTASVQTNSSLDGKSLRLTVSSQANWANVIYFQTASVQPGARVTYTFNMYNISTIERGSYCLFLDAASNVVFGLGAQSYGTTDPIPYVAFYSNGVGSGVRSYTLSQNGWHQFNMDYDPNNRTVTYSVYSPSGTLLYTCPNVQTLASTITKCVLRASAGQTSYREYYFDNVTYSIGINDADGDGMSDTDELVAGTNPTNRNSVLRMEMPTTGPTPTNKIGHVVQWQSVTGKYYRLDRSTNLVLVGWLPLKTNLPGASGNTVYTDTTGTNRLLYYRVKVER